MSALPSCAVIGTGGLGGPIAERLLAQGHAVTACDRDAARIAPLVALGAHAAASAGDCADCEAALIVVATGPQVEAVAGDLAARLGRAPRPVLRRVAVMSTVPPATVRKVDALLRPRGIAVLDAPNSGGAPRALAGRLTIMAGGAPADLDAFRLVLSSLADNIFPCGALGAGQIAKIVNNLLCHTNTTLMAEALRLGMAHGLAAEAMAQVMEVSTGRNYLTAQPGDAVEAMARYSGDRAVFDDILTILKKDMEIAADLAAAEGHPSPMIAGLCGLIGGLGDETFATWRRVAGPGGAPPAR